MKFLCDVHIPIKLAKFITKKGFECIHINTILDKWFTSDNKISEFSDLNDYILITKDIDFKNSFLIQKTPKKLIKINLGNTSNDNLISYFESHLDNFHLINDQNQSFMIELDEGFISVITEN